MKMSTLMTDLILKIFGYAFISSAIIGFLHDIFILIYSIIIIRFKLEMPMPLENYSLFGRLNFLCLKTQDSCFNACCISQSVLALHALHKRKFP